jgi:hypothetical protein
MQNRKRVHRGKAVNSAAHAGQNLSLLNTVLNNEHFFDRPLWKKKGSNRWNRPTYRLFPQNELE